METNLTYEKVLELIREQSITFNQNLEKSRIEFEKKLEQERISRSLSSIEFDNDLKKSREEFDIKLGEITGTWGKFVAEMVKPKIIELFKEKGISIETAAQKIEGFKDGQRYYEIDLLLVNTKIAVAVEI